MSEYQIEQGIPLPEPQTGRYAKGKGVLRSTMERLEIGQSIVVEPLIRNRLHVTARDAGIRVSCRKQQDGLIRVWRIA